MLDNIYFKLLNGENNYALAA